VFPIKYKKPISILVAILIVFALIVSISGCNSSSGKVPADTDKEVTGSSEKTNNETVGTAGQTKTTSAAEAEKVNLYDLKLVDGKLAIWFFSLTGEDHVGESILIRTPKGKTILVDSGTAEGGVQVLDYLQKLEIETIDYCIATHMHIDHIGGFPSIINKLEVKEVYTSTFTEYDTSPVRNFFTALKQKNIEYKEAIAGMEIKIDEDVTISFLYPFEDTIPDDLSNVVIDGTFINDSSVVFRLTYGENSFLFTGDITMMSDMKLVDKYGDGLKSDVIKVPHHGSEDASSEVFVKTVDADYSVMCIYAFNSLDIYNRYKKYGYRPYVTSLDGTVLSISDGTNIDFITEKERKGMLK